MSLRAAAGVGIANIPLATTRTSSLRRLSRYDDDDDDGDDDDDDDDGHDDPDDDADETVHGWGACKTPRPAWPAFAAASSSGTQGVGKVLGVCLRRLFLQFLDGILKLGEEPTKDA